jgi:hypothetical protein
VPITGGYVLSRERTSQRYKILFLSFSSSGSGSFLPLPTFGCGNTAKDRKVIPDPIDDRKLQERKESGKSGILLAITLNPRKCIGEKDI